MKTLFLLLYPIFLLLYLGLLLPLIVCAQSPAVARPDTILGSSHLEISQEVDTSRAPKRRFSVMYRRFIRSQIEEKTLIKVGTWLPAGSNFIVTLSSEIAVERKLTPAFSVLAGLHAYYVRSYNPDQSIGRNERETLTGILAGRWYYAMNRLIRTGKSANNFSSQYVALQSSLSVWQRTTADDPRISIGRRYDTWIGLGWGLQRRLGRLAYIDANIGLSYTFERTNPIMPQLNLFFGFGL